MRLLQLHPGVAARSCDDCRRWWYEDVGGRFGKRMTRGGRDVPRPPQSPTPCGWCPKIPPGREPRPENAAELTPQLWDCYQHYLESRAVGQFPDDPIVRAAAALIRQAEDAAARRIGLTVLDTLTRRPDG